MPEIQSTRVIVSSVGYDFNDPHAFSQSVDNSIETTLTDKTVIWMYDVLNTVDGPNISMRVVVTAKGYDHSDKAASSEIVGGTDGKFTLDDGTVVWVYGFVPTTPNETLFSAFARRTRRRV